MVDVLLLHCRNNLLFLLLVVDWGIIAWLHVRRGSLHWQVHSLDDLLDLVDRQVRIGVDVLFRLIFEK